MIKKEQVLLTRAVQIHIKTVAVTEGDDQFKEGVMWPYLLMVNASVNETKYSEAVRGSQLYQSRYNLWKNYRAVEDSRAGEYFFEGQISCKKGTRVYKKGLAGVHVDKAFNSKAVQEALQLATQMAEMPSVQNSKYGRNKVYKVPYTTRCS